MKTDINPMSQLNKELANEVLKDYDENYTTSKDNIACYMQAYHERMMGKEKEDAPNRDLYINNILRQYGEKQ